MIDIKTMTILIVDDMKSMRLTLRKMLRNLEIGKELLFADNGKSGLNVMKNYSCDLLIVDWSMPGMNGSRMLANVRRDKDMRDIPVIMVTAENERDIVADVAEYEVEGYLLKPLTLAALDSKIKSVVEAVNHPEKAKLHLLEARACEEAGNIQGAIDETKSALRLKPNASRILRKLGLLYLQTQNAEMGEKCLQKAVAVNRQDTISRNHLAKLYINRRAFKQAARVYMEILSFSTRYFDSAVQLGEMLLINEFRNEARTLFLRILSKSRFNRILRERIIDICLDNQEYEFVAEIVTDAIKENPSNLDLLYKAGTVYLETGDQEKAMECFVKVDNKRRGDINTKFQIARIHIKNKRIILADDYLNRILRIDPSNKEALEMRRQI
ncbi:response regulator [Desulfobacter latus]|uniref:Response regulator n=1 Tax=Desulfobacter latus TaxID=2292 RepID=A0A850TA31_9BACT|nr:response regulator [Desulfobacter latus]NWH05077.1 response regulator [Desulfobacter latus]